MSSINYDKILTYDKISKSEFSVQSQRDLYAKIDSKVQEFNSNSAINIFAIAGLRGTGKTTILKTIAKKYEDSLYISGDYMRTSSLTLDDVVDYISRYDSKIVLIDEIHNLENWGEKLKIISDLYKSKLFIITASSSLLLRKEGSRIKRRAIFYDIHSLSFREYLKIKHGFEIKENLEFISDIFVNSKKIEDYYLKLLEIEQKLPSIVYTEYNDYLERQFPITLNLDYPYNVTKDIVDRAIDKDIPLFTNLTSKTLTKITSIVQYLSLSEKTNISKISRLKLLNQDTVEKIIESLQLADIIEIIEPYNSTNTLKGLNKYGFTSPSVRLAYSLHDTNKTIGYAREDQFYNIAKSLGYIPKYIFNQGEFDFVVNKRVFEIGGRQKRAKNVIIVAQNQKLRYNRDTNTLYIPLEILSLAV